MKQHSLLRGVAVTLCVFVLLFGGAYLLLGRIDTASQQAETQLVRDAVRSAALTCYAVEGAYPQSLAHLESEYGLRYNKDAFIVVYNAFASNIMPEIRVLEKGGQNP